MKKIVGLVGTLLLIGVVWAVSTYPQVGKLIYKSAISAEAAVYGFDKRSQQLSEIEMVYFVAGSTEKPTIIMLHGYSADKDVWLRFGKHFTDDYQVIIPDLAGHGETGFKAEWDYSIAAQTDRVAELLDALGIERAHIIGNSMGGYISAAFAITYSERTLSVAPMNPAGVTTPQPSDMDRMLAEGRNPFLLKNKQEFKEFYHMTMARPPWLPQIVLDAMAEDYRIRQSQLAAIFDDLQKSAPLTDRLGQIEAPALVLWGSEDALIHVSGAERWHELMPNSQLQVWENIGHMPMLEIPAESAERYREFLQSL